MEQRDVLVLVEAKASSFLEMIQWVVPWNVWKW
jgi:hypothetical protein